MRKVTERQSPKMPINTEMPTNMSIWLQLEKDWGHKLFFFGATTGNPDNIISSDTISIFHSRSVIKERIVEHTGDFPHLRKGGTLIVSQ